LVFPLHPGRQKTRLGIHGNHEEDNKVIKSMTAYGRGETASEDLRFVVEIKSVNNRFRDFQIRIPKILQPLEDELKALLSSRISRGRVEVAIQMERQGSETTYDLELNLPLVRSYVRIFEQLGKDFGFSDRIGPDVLCQMRDVIQVIPQDLEAEEVREPLKNALIEALDSHQMMRLQEGKALNKDFLHRLDLMKTYMDEIEEQAPLVVETYRQRLKHKMESLSQEVELDKGRFIQEVAFFAEKCDITEEITRARSHIEQFRHYLASEGAVGRRLDFLLQEINREVNTMSAKASDASISAKVVEVKAELEKIKEQVQNVE
jgi:uncharacterized protein (TIGR00255 family)